MSAASLLFPAPPVVAIPVTGQSAAFPVNRIYCVGRNYAEHAKEMGFEVDREAPFYFLKPRDAIVHTGATIPYPPGTQNCHYEIEFVVALDKPAFRISEADAMSVVYGYACGIDLTRRDLQISHREKGRPWDFGKAFDKAAIIAPITPKAVFGEIGEQPITLKQNGVLKQDSKLAELIWSVPEIISHLSRYYHLQPGDLIYTGTPAGVGPVKPGDVIEGEVGGLAPLSLTIGAAE